MKLVMIIKKRMLRDVQKLSLALVTCFLSPSRIDATANVVFSLGHS